MRISQVSSVRIPPHMTMRKRSAIVSPDGILDLPATPVIADNEKYGAPELQGNMVVRGITHNAHLALAERLAQEGQLEVIGKSGSSRVGLEVIQRDGEKVQVDHQAGSIIVPVGVLSVRAVEVRQNGVRDDLLSVLAAITRERDVAIGRVAMADPADALSREEVLAAFQKNELALPAHPSPEACVDEQGHLVLPLESLRFAFCEANFRTAQKRDVIRFGKHGLAGLQEERQGLPKEIGGKQFFVGGIRVSIGPYIGIIDAETNKPGVVHLAARILDGIRTTGLDDPRQVELFNQLYDAVSTGDLRVRIRLHHASKDAQQFAKCVINRRTIVSGVSLPDVIELQGHPERIMDLMRLVSPSVADGNPCGYFVGPQSGVGGRSKRRIPKQASGDRGTQVFRGGSGLLCTGAGDTTGGGSTCRFARLCRAGPEPLKALRTVGVSGYRHHALYEQIRYRGICGTRCACGSGAHVRKQDTNAHAQAYGSFFTSR